MAGDNRSATRYRCGIPCEVKVAGGVTKGIIRDISNTGIRLQTSDVMNVWTGDQVEITCSELGYIQGVARWRRPKMIGVELAASTNTLAKVESYFKHYANQALAS